MSVTTASEITSAANYTAQTQAAQPKSTGSASKMGSTEFMNLMMKQLQYQDPMSPVSNAEFIAQQAQFTQLSTTQEMSTNIASNNAVSEALSLVGKSVTITDPNDSTKTITGSVKSATISGKNSTININGTDYGLSYLKSVNTATTTTTN